jgi:tRNA threonylcarbamoyladenosine biosynthesis protein TsaB
MQVHESKQQRILAIECAVGRGSLAIVDRGSVIASTLDTAESPSRAEELMIAIDGLIRRSGIALTELELIAVSTGPGSYSGIRIGVATALGLKTALNIPCIGVPILEAMARSISDVVEFVTAVSVGKKDVAWQSFTIDGDALITSVEPELAPKSNFVAAMNSAVDTVVFAQTGLITQLEEHSLEARRVRDIGETLAGFVGIAAANGYGGEPRPIYLRNKSHTAASPGF